MGDEISLVRLARLYWAARIALGTDAEARLWLATPLPSLGGKMPGELISDDWHLDEAMLALHRARGG